MGSNTSPRYNVLLSVMISGAGSAEFAQLADSGVKICTYPWVDVAH